MAAYMSSAIASDTKVASVAPSAIVKLAVIVPSSSTCPKSTILLISSGGNSVSAPSPSGSSIFNLTVKPPAGAGSLRWKVKSCASPPSVIVVLSALKLTTRRHLGFLHRVSLLVKKQTATKRYPNLRE